MARYEYRYIAWYGSLSLLGLLWLWSLLWYLCWSLSILMWSLSTGDRPLVVQFAACNAKQFGDAAELVAPWVWYTGRLVHTVGVQCNRLMASRCATGVCHVSVFQVLRCSGFELRVSTKVSWAALHFLRYGAIVWIVHTIYCVQYNTCAHAV